MRDSQWPQSPIKPSAQRLAKAPATADRQANLAGVMAKFTGAHAG